MPVTFGAGAGEGEAAGVAAGAGDAAETGVEPAGGVAAPWGVGCCALALYALAANIPDNRRNVRNSEFVVLFFMVFFTFGLMRRCCKEIARPGEVTIGDEAVILIAGLQGSGDCWQTTNSFGEAFTAIGIGKSMICHQNRSYRAL